MSDSTAVSFETVEILKYRMDGYVLLVAAAVGIVIILIGYFFSGGKNNKGAILFSFIVSTLVGILTLPGFLLLADKMGLNGPFVNTILIVCDFMFIALISCHAYEMTTVTAREAHPD